VNRPGPALTRPGVAGSPILLMLRALGLGDFLTGLPAFRALAAAYPEHHLVLAMPPALELLGSRAGIAGEVLPVHGTGGLDPLDRQWAARPRPNREVDTAVNLHGRGPDSHRVLLGLGPRRLIAFAHPDVAAVDDRPRWREDEHEVVRWCRLLGESGIPADPSRLELVPPPVESVAPHPGGRQSSTQGRRAARGAGRPSAGRRWLATSGTKAARWS
jgi:ADP-heptose:LPS heptosyltransferase